MSWEQPGFKLGTQVAAADLRTHQYKFVKMTSTGINICTAATDDCLGVLQNKPNTGEACEIDCSGVSKMIAGAAVTAGDKVTSDATGRAITYASPGAYTAGSNGHGIALEAATAAAQVIAVKLYPSII